jgi:hypothetical protein
VAPESPRFDLPTLLFLDDNLKPAVLSAPDLIAIARALRLAVPGGTARTGTDAGVNAVHTPEMNRIAAWHGRRSCAARYQHAGRVISGQVFPHAQHGST